MYAIDRFRQQDPPHYLKCIYSYTHIKTDFQGLLGSGWWVKAEWRLVEPDPECPQGEAVGAEIEEMPPFEEWKGGYGSEEQDRLFFLGSCRTHAELHLWAEKLVGQRFDSAYDFCQYLIREGGSYEDVVSNVQEVY